MKKILSLLSAVIISFSLIGCGPGDYDGKMINNSMMNSAKVTGLERAPYRGSRNIVHTDKGDFVVYTIHNEYFSQLEDFYKLYQQTDKDLIIDIGYLNNVKIDDKMYEIKTIIIRE